MNPPPSPPSLRQQVISDAVREYIKEYIIARRLPPGSPLPTEAQLSEALGISRSSVREAVKALQSLGLIEVRRGNGLFVRETNFDAIGEILTYNLRLNPSMLQELLHVRMWLESAVIAEAIPQLQPSDLLDLKQIMQQWSVRVHTMESTEELDERFHRVLYRSLGNSTLNKILEVFWVALHAYGGELKELSPAEMQQQYQKHQSILDAVEAQDVQAAKQRLVDHFADSKFLRNLR